MANAVSPSLGTSGISSRTVPVPWGRARVREYHPSPDASTPGIARVARKSSSGPPAYGVRTASRIVTVPVVDRRPRRPRRSEGVLAYTSRIVSLNCRTLEKPDANAMSA